jgi:hypothetical protein
MLCVEKNIKSAFRLLNVYPGDFDLLGIKFLDEYFQLFYIGQLN